MIVKMSKYDLILYAAQAGDFVEKLRALGLVDITTTGWEPSDADRGLLAEIEGHTRAVEALEKFTADDRFDAKAKPFGSGEEAYAHYTETTKRATALQGEIARLQKIADEVRPWGNFSPEKLHAIEAHALALHYFVASRSVYDKQHVEWPYVVVPIHSDGVNTWFVVVTDVGDEVALDAQPLKAPQMSYREAEKQITGLRHQLAALDGEFSRAAASTGAIRRNAGAVFQRLFGNVVQGGGIGPPHFGGFIVQRIPVPRIVQDDVVKRRGIGVW